jgi:hypothetical protein
VLAGFERKAPPTPRGYGGQAQRGAKGTKSAEGLGVGHKRHKMHKGVLEGRALRDLVVGGILF